MTVAPHSIHLKYIIYALPEAVFEALTNQEILEKWVEGQVVFELKPEGQVSLFDGWMKGKVVKFNRNDSFSYTWKPSTWQKKDKESLVEFQFRKVQAGTEVEIMHSGFPSESEASNHEQGWLNFILDPLNDYFIGLMNTEN